MLPKVMVENSKPNGRKEETSAKIITAAQQLFSEKGYSNAGLREIAQRSGVAGSLVIKYFLTKANLFEIALKNALIDPQFFQQDRSKFGETLVETLNDRNLSLIQPAMIALSIGDEEAQGIIAKVSHEFVLTPMAEWLGTPDAKARASYILMLTMGYLIFARHIAMDDSAATRDETAKLVAQGLQAIVDSAKPA